MLSEWEGSDRRTEGQEKALATGEGCGPALPWWALCPPCIVTQWHHSLQASCLSEVAEYIELSGLNGSLISSRSPWGTGLEIWLWRMNSVGEYKKAGSCWPWLPAVGERQENVLDVLLKGLGEQCGQQAVPMVSLKKL